MRFALPYFADRSRPYPLATAVVNDKTNDLEGVAPFLKEMVNPGPASGIPTFFISAPGCSG